MFPRASLLLLSLFLGVAAAAAISNGAYGGVGCCAHCGHEANCQKICRLVEEQKTVTTTCWGVRCENFCDPCPSQRGAKHCETVCDESHDPKAPCVQPKRFVWTEWLPTGTKRIYTRKKLMKKTISKTIPSYKWVVEEVCSQCEPNCVSVEVPAEATIPPCPAAGAKLK